MNAEFLDIFGFIGFAILLFSGIKVLKSKDKLIKRYGLIITIISIIGLIVESFIIIKTYF
jgi:hypothetical protein